MIAVITDNLGPLANKAEQQLGLVAELDLLGKPYIDRLAERYRELGVSDVLWATRDPSVAPGATGVAGATGRKRPWTPMAERSALNDAIDNGELVLIADIRLWPDEETGRLLGEAKHSITDLISFVIDADRDDYLEVIEPIGCTVMRRYGDRGAREAGSFHAAITVRPKSLGDEWGTLLNAALSGNVPEIRAVTKGRRYQVLESALWIESAHDYLLLAKHLLSSGRAPDPEATALKEGVWVMPGAQVDASCAIEGPAFFGRGCRVGRGTRVVGPASIGESASVGEGCVVGESVIMNDSLLPRGVRLWYSLIGPGRTLEEEQACTFGWLDGEDVWHRIEPARRHHAGRADHQLASVIVPSWWSVWKHQAFSAGKRSMDIGGAVVGLTVTLPLYPFIAAAIKLENPGPVFYVHCRQTRYGREFGCIKFRSMVNDAQQLQQKLPNEVDGPQFYIKDDPRLTRVGRLLRRTNLDEVPQFWNVLLGHMSLVGPRPSPDGENQYCPAWREARLSVRPGLTGMWQTRRSPDRSGGDFHEWIKYDVQYVRECSLHTDLRLLFDTIRQIARRFRGGSLATRGKTGK